MNENFDLTWIIYRDGHEHHRAVSYQQVQRIIRHAQRVYPVSRFTARYNGRNLGVRSSKEYCG